MIYLAPLQGFTDFVYRKTFAAYFNGVGVFFIPYISVKNNVILKKYIREILPKNNPEIKTIPQLLAKDSGEMLFLTTQLKQFGYTEINLNMGCPYPMVTNRGKGSGLLPHPGFVESMLSKFYEKSNLKLSVKLRSGLDSPTEIEPIITVLNNFPLTEVIYHPRIAKQLYNGKVDQNSFQRVAEQCVHPLVFNGDIFTTADFKTRSAQLPTVKRWMLGRGILMNPFLPAELSGQVFTEDKKRAKLMAFQQEVFEKYCALMDNQGNALNKMKQFWIYFSHNFEIQHKILKKVRKIKSAADYQKQVNGLFNNYEIKMR